MATLQELAAGDVDFLFEDIGTTSITYTPSGGDGAAIDAVLNDLRREGVIDSDGRQAEGSVILHVKQSDVSDPGVGLDKVTISSDVYVVVDRLKIGTGLWRLTCTRTEQIQHSGPQLYRE